jgi:hypothetical protein
MWSNLFLLRLDRLERCVAVCGGLVVFCHFLLQKSLTLVAV